MNKDMRTGLRVVLGIFAAGIIISLLILWAASSPAPVYCGHGPHGESCPHTTIVLIPVIVGKVTVMQPHLIPCSCRGRHE